MLTYKDLTNTFGRDVVCNLKKYENISRKLANLKNRRIFLLRCKTEKIQPTFLNFNCKHINFSNVNIQHRFDNQIFPKFIKDTINMLISDTTVNIKNLQMLIDTLTDTIKNALSTETYNTFIKQTKEKIEKLFLKKKLKNQNKINKLLHTKQKNEIKIRDINESPKWIKNLTDIEIPNDIADILMLGPNFAIDIKDDKNIPTDTIISNIEVGINHLPNYKKDQIRAKTCNILTNFKQKIKNNKQQTSINKKLIKTQHYLKQHPNIKILKADKTNKTVIMNSVDYENKMNDILNDKKTYKLVKLDPTNTYQKKNNDLIKSWQHNDYISPSLAKSLITHNAVPPKIYGLPKLHKENISLRPIVSCIQSPFNLQNLKKIF